MIDEYANTLALIASLAGIVFVGVLVWYERKQARQWSEYGRAINAKGERNDR